jgi:hypothetical protein
LIARNVFAEEHDVGFEDTAAGCARRHDERREINLAEIGVTVWQRLGVPIGPRQN